MRILRPLILCLFAVSGFAQNATRIDGRQHPELIPDTAAYRAVFLMHSHSATPQEIARSEQFHARIALSRIDHYAYEQALATFRQHFDGLVAAHNAFVDASASVSIDDMKQEGAAFKQSLSALVQQTRNQLASVMTNDGLAKLDAFVQSEKAHMTVGVRSQQ